MLNLSPLDVSDPWGPVDLDALPALDATTLGLALNDRGLSPLTVAPPSPNRDSFTPCPPTPQSPPTSPSVSPGLVPPACGPRPAPLAASRRASPTAGPPSAPHPRPGAPGKGLQLEQIEADLSSQSLSLSQTQPRSQSLSPGAGAGDPCEVSSRPVPPAPMAYGMRRRRAYGTRVEVLRATFRHLTPTMVPAHAVGYQVNAVAAMKLTPIQMISRFHPQLVAAYFKHKGVASLGDHYEHSDYRRSVLQLIRLAEMLQRKDGDIPKACQLAAARRMPLRVLRVFLGVSEGEARRLTRQAFANQASSASASSG